MPGPCTPSSAAGIARKLSAAVRLREQACHLVSQRPRARRPGAPLTIDVHAHIFNGSDLQIREFLAQTALDDDSELKGVAQAVGSLLQTIAWNAAPDAREETKYIEHPTTSPTAAVPTVFSCAKPSLQRSRTAMRAVGASCRLQRSRHACGPSRAAVLSPDRTSPGLGAAINALPDTLDEFEQQSRGEVSVLGSQPHLKGYLQFVLHNFNHRHVNAIDYLSTYSKGSVRKSTSSFLHGRLRLVAGPRTAHAHLIEGPGGIDGRHLAASRRPRPRLRVLLPVPRGDDGGCQRTRRRDAAGSARDRAARLPRREALPADGLRRLGQRRPDRLAG